MGAGSGGGGGAALLPLLLLLLLLLLLQPTSTLAQWVWPGQGGPLGSQNFNVSCEKLTCGKGNCSFSSSRTNSSYSYSYNYSYSSNDSFECQCASGWKKYSDKSQYLYLPCVIPKCNFGRSCPQSFMNQKPKSLPQSPFNPNENIDPCSWAICGEGTCKNTSAFSYICECKSGYKNILNTSSLPCYQDCEGGINESCQALGIGTKRTSSTQSGSNAGSSKGATTAPASLPGCLLVMMVSLLALA